MDEAALDIALVRKAITSGLSNCLLWVNEKAASLVRSNPANRGLTPEAVKQLLVTHVLQGAAIERRREERPNWQSRREYWFRTVIPLSEFPRGLFVELELFDPDPDVPVVLLLNAHPEPG